MADRLRSLTLVESSYDMHTTSLTLLKRVRQTNDQAAWNRFVSLYSPLLFAFARRASMNDSDAADVVQDVFLVLMAELPGLEYDGVRKNFRGWLKTITVNKCRERQRRRVVVSEGNESGLSGVVDDATVSKFWENEYQKHLIARALEIMQAEFEPTTWQACWQTTVKERPVADVAAELGITINAVYVARSRVLRRLREELRDLLDE